MGKEKGANTKEVLIKNNTNMITCSINPDKLRSLRSSIKAGIINLREIDEFLERLEMQLPESKRKPLMKEIYYHGKKIKVLR